MSLRRDDNLRLLILRSVRDGATDPKLDEVEAQEPELVTYNCALLVDSGFIEGVAIRNAAGNYASVKMLHLFTSKLEEREFIVQATRHGQDAGIFRLSPEGREYVVKNRLL
jgi:hypothetical protein